MSNAGSAGFVLRQVGESDVVARETGLEPFVGQRLVGIVGRLLGGGQRLAGLIKGRDLSRVHCRPDFLDRGLGGSDVGSVLRTVVGFDDRVTDLDRSDGARRCILGDGVDRVLQEERLGDVAAVGELGRTDRVELERTVGRIGDDGDLGLLSRVQRRVGGGGGRALCRHREPDRVDAT